MYQPQTNPYSYYPQQQQYMQRPPISMNLKGRPVSSIEEARAASIDFDGSIFYFPDLANRRIYTKQINLDGTSTLNLYELKEIPQGASTSLDSTMFVTREELENILKQLRSDLQSQQSSPSQPSYPQF